MNNSEPDPDFGKMARESLTCEKLSTFVEEAKGEMAKSGLYPQNFSTSLKDSAKFVCSEDDDLYKEIIEFLRKVLKKGDAELYYQRFYGSVLLRSSSLLKNKYTDGVSKVVMMYLGDKILSFSKFVSVKTPLKRSTRRVSIKDCERGPLNYLTGYVIRSLFQKCRKRVAKQQNSPETEEFIALLNSLHIDKEMATSNEYTFIKDKDRGGLWYPKEYLVKILFTTEMEFRLATESDELCHKVNCNQIVEKLLKDSLLRSYWTMLVDECSMRISTQRAMIFLVELLGLYLKVRTFSYSKDVLQKYKLEKKASKKKALRKEMKGKERCKDTS